MAGTYTPTGTYANLTRLELEQLRRGDFTAGGKTLTIGDSALLPEGVVGKGNVNSEAFYTNAVLTLADVSSLTPITQPGKFLSRNVSNLYNNGQVSLGVVWYGPDSIQNGIASAGFLSAPNVFTDVGNDFVANGVLPGDLILSESSGTGYPVGTVLTVNSTTNITATNITGGGWANNGCPFYDIVRPSAVQVFAVPGSGPTGQEQTFLFVLPGSTLHNTVGPTTDDINLDRIKDIVSPRYALDSTVDRADSVYVSPAPHTTVDLLGYRVVLYPDDGSGLAPDLTSPIASLNPTIDPAIPADDQRVTIDYAAGVIRLSCAPAIGGQIKVPGGVNPITGRLNLYAVFWAVEKALSTGAATQLIVPANETSQKLPPAAVQYNGTTWTFHVPDGSGEEIFSLHGGPGVGGFYIRTNEAVAAGRTLVGKMNSPVFTVGDGVSSYGDYSVDTCITQAVAALASSPFKSVTILIKPGTYWLNTTTITVPAGKELILRGYSKEDCIIRFNTTAEGFNVPADSQLVLENLFISDLNSNAGGIIINGSIRAKNCVFQVVNWQFRNPVPMRKAGGVFPSAAPPVAIVEDCEFYNHDAIGLFAYQFSFYQDTGVSWGYFFNNCAVYGAQFGESLCLIHSSAVGSPRSITGIHFTKCNLTVQLVTSASTTAIGRPSGVMHVDPSGGIELLTLDDVAFDDCNVKVFNFNAGANTILLSLMPIAWDATQAGFQRVLIGRVRIRGGTWSVPDARGTDFVPFFLQCFHPHVENVSFIGGNLKGTSFNTGPGFRGHGHYTDAQKAALREFIAYIPSGGAKHCQFWCTIAAGGGALDVMTGTGIKSMSAGLVVKDLTFREFNRLAGPSGVFGLIGPSNRAGIMDVNGVTVYPRAGVTGNTVTVNCWMGVGPGGVQSGRPGSQGTIRNLAVQVDPSEITVAAGDTWFTRCALAVMSEGRLVLDGLDFAFTKEGGTIDGPGNFGAMVVRPHWPWDGAPISSPGGPIFFKNVRIKGYTTGFVGGDAFSATDLPPQTSIIMGPWHVDQWHQRSDEPFVSNVKRDFDVRLSNSSYKLASMTFNRLDIVHTFVNNANCNNGGYFDVVNWQPDAWNSLTNSRIVADYGANASGSVICWTVLASGAGSLNWNISGNELIKRTANVYATNTMRLQIPTSAALTTPSKYGGAGYVNCETGFSGENGTYTNGGLMQRNIATLTSG